MTAARGYLLVVLWLQGILLQHAAMQVQQGLHRFLQLRLELLTDPAAATWAFCSAAKSAAARPAPTSACRTQLSWWRQRDQEFELCADLDAGATGLNLAAPRRYHLTLSCGFLHLGGATLQLPLLSATLFR